MSAAAGEGHDPRCSFCGTGPSEVGHLIAGLGVWICDGCVRVCSEILDGLQRRPREVDVAGTPQEAADPVPAEIARAQQLALGGDRPGAVVAFDRVWRQLGPGSDPLHRIRLAHYLADVQDSPAEELDWDLRALAVADSVPRDAPAWAAIRGLYASLQVNVAADYEELGRREESGDHLAQAQAAERDLPADGYGSLVRSEIEALRRRLDARE